MCTIKESINSFEALCNWIRELIQLKSSLIRPTRLRYGKMLELESSPIQLHGSLIELESSPIYYRISQIRELCYGELSHSMRALQLIRELSNSLKSSLINRVYVNLAFHSPGLWLAETFSTSPLTPLSRIQWNLTCRKQDLNVVYQVCVFWGRGGGSRWPPGLWLAETFSTSPLKQLNGIQQNLTGRKISMPLPILCFSGRSENQDGRPSIWSACAFSFCPLNRIQRKSTGSKISTSYIGFVFIGRSENQDRSPTSDWPRHFWLLWNCWTEFNETWKDIRYQRPLQMLCFSGWLRNQDGRAGLWLADTFLTSSLQTTERNSTKLDWKQGLNVLYQVCVFRAHLFRKQRWPLMPGQWRASDWPRHFRLVS